MLSSPQNIMKKQQYFLFYFQENPSNKLWPGCIKKSPSYKNKLKTMITLNDLNSFKEKSTNQKQN